MDVAEDQIAIVVTVTDAAVFCESLSFLLFATVMVTATVVSVSDVLVVRTADVNVSSLYFSYSAAAAVPLSSNYPKRAVNLKKVTALLS